MLSRLKQKWSITSPWQFWAIMLTFTLAGLSITQVRRPLFHLFGIEPETPFWIKTVVYLASIFPLYQLFLMMFGTLLGQFRFFWEKEKAMVRWLLRRPSRTNSVSGNAP
jgi:hypothetical protein